MNAADVELVVREVLLRLGQTTSATTPTTQSPSQAQPAPAQSPRDRGRLVLRRRLITLAELDGSCDDIREVVVPHRAVVTPAALDRLKYQGISVVRADPTVTTGTTRNVMLANEHPRYCSAGLVRRLSALGLAVQQLPRCGLRTALAELALAVARDGVMAAVVTHQRHLAVCLANRFECVRAVLGGGTDQDEAVSETGANVLIMNPLGSTQNMERMTERFLTAGPVPAPG